MREQRRRLIALALLLEAACPSLCSQSVSDLVVTDKLEARPDARVAYPSRTSRASSAFLRPAHRWRLAV